MVAHFQLHDELSDFIDTNAEFITVSTASPRLLAGSHVDLLMRLAHVRHEMPMCLEAVAKYGTESVAFFNVTFINCVYADLLNIDLLLMV